MKISLNWIKQFVPELPTDMEPHQLALLFTSKTAEVEGVENQAANLEKIMVGQIMEIHPHPNADKLRITKTSIGKETLQIVCGAPNIHEGQYVAVALVGAKVRWHGEGDLIVLTPAKIRDVESFGMICAGDEIGLEPTPEGILDISALKPTPGESLAKLLGKDDVILTIDNKSLTHRPDLWGHYGIAREIAAITGKNLAPKNIQVDFPTAGESPKIEVKEKKLCPRYLGALIENIKIEESPQWLKNQLLAVGYRPISNIVDITNYVMAELGQPLHAFDYSKIDTGIIVRRAKNNEEFQTLDGVNRKLDKDTLVIADHKKALAIAGIMGGANSEIDSSTTQILIESANFNPSSVRKSSVRLGLRTEAVQRFEKSLDPLLAHEAMLRVCQLILQICPTAKICGPLTDVNNFKEKKNVVTVDLKKVFSKIGKEIPAAEVLSILERLEFKIEVKGYKSPSEKAVRRIKVEIPSFRATKDISIEDDLVEEIARMHGYNNIEPKLPELSTKLPIENRERKLKHFARQILSYGLGFNEIYNYSFYSLKDIQKSLLPEELHVRIKNYLSEDQTHLRISLVPNILKSIALNLKNYNNFKLYEIGRTYQDLQEYFPIEEKKICGVIVEKTGKKTASSAGKHNEEIFYEAKGALEEFLKQFHLAGIEMQKGETFCPYAHPNKYAAYYSKTLPKIGINPTNSPGFALHDNSQEIARVFELHPLVAKNYGIEDARIAIFEINFTRIAAAVQQEIKYRQLPKFPGIEIDISFLIDQKTEIGKVQKNIANCDKQLIRAVELFDIYQGPNIPAGKKSLAFKVIMRADDRTLTDAEMKTVQQKIFAEITKLGGEIRK